MEKKTVSFSREVKVGEKSFSGDLEVKKPLMGDIADAAEICPPQNAIGFGMAVMGGILDIPYSVMRSMDPDDFMVLQTALEPVLPKM